MSGKIVTMNEARFEESTKPWKETFGNKSESKLTTRDVGLDKEEMEEALILLRSTV